MCMACEIGKIVINKCLEGNIFINTQKLEKLLVLMQIEHLKRVKKELFSEKILVWKCGVVIQEVDYEFSKYAIECKEKQYGLILLLEEQEETIEYVLKTYGNMDAYGINELPVIKSLVANMLNNKQEEKMEHSPKFEVGKVIEIVPYETLSEETRSLVDNEVTLLRGMQDSEIMPYGWDIQSSKNDILNNAISSFETLSVERIEDILGDIMNSRKSVTPRKRTLLRKEYIPTTVEKKKFVGKVGDLEDAIKMQIKRILENNENYVRLIHECKNIVDRYAISIMAIEKYLTGPHDTFLEDILKEKKVSLANSRISNVQSAVMYMTLYKNNGLLVNRLYEIINVNLHQLQEQVLIQTEINEIKKVLGQCKDIKDSIIYLTANNFKELNSTTELVLSSNSEIPKVEDEEKLTKQMMEGLRALEAREIKKEEKEGIVCSPEEVEISNRSADEIYKSVEKDLRYIEFEGDAKRLGFVLVEAESLSLSDEFMKHIPKNEREKKAKELIIEAIQRGTKNFWKPRGDVSFTPDGEGICYSPGKMPAVGKSYDWHEKAAKKLWPTYNSRLGSMLEYAAFIGVLIKKLIEEGKTVEWAWNAVCCDSRELGHYLNSENAKHAFEPTGSREICGFCDLANAHKILAWDVEVDSFWVASGYYLDDDNIWPISQLALFWNRNTVRICSVGWPVISYVA